MLTMAPPNVVAELFAKLVYANAQVAGRLVGDAAA